MRIILFLSIIVLMFSCADNENEYIGSVMENEPQHERVVKCLVDGDSLYLIEVDGLLLFEGDIIIGKTREEPLSRSIGLKLNNLIWTDNIVYYEISTGIGMRIKTEILSAINHWQDKTNIIFLPRGAQKNYISFEPIAGSVSYSYVGMIGGKQEIFLAPASDFGNIVHEIGHSLGLEHEHSRADRDNYVTVHLQNIQQQYRYAYDILKNRLLVGDFDLNSVMLYSSMNFSINGLPTLTKKDGSVFRRKDSLSTGDIAIVNARYPYVSIYGKENATSLPADYDGDGKTDLSIWTTEGYWFIDYAYNGFGKWDWIGSGYGGPTSTPVPADYDGDGKVDLSLKNTGENWYIDYAANGFNGWDWSGGGYGGSTATPVPADYDGDGKIDISVKNTGGNWYIDYAANGFNGWDWSGGGYGGETATPVPADYDGDGKIDLSVKNTGGYWYIDYAVNGFNGWDWSSGGYGGATATPVPADYDGDGKIDLSVKNTGGYWYIDYAANGFNGWDWSAGGYGGATATPVSRDYDGDGKIDLSVKNTGEYWYIDYAANGFNGWDWSGGGYGGSTATAVPADYDGDGKIDLSVKNTGGNWYIDYATDGFNGWNWSNR